MDIRLEDIENKIMNLIEESWILNGHPNTGAFVESLESIRREDGFDIVGNSYGLAVNYGVSPENIPYTRRSRGQGKGGQSKYITGLKNWAMTKLGIGDEREALSVAFAIAEKHKEFGMKGSGYLTKVVLEYQGEIDKMVENYISQQIHKNL